MPCLSHRRTMIRVLCVDDHPLIRKGIASILANEPDMELVAEAATGDEAVRLFRRASPRRDADGSAHAASSTASPRRSAIRCRVSGRAHHRADQLRRRPGHLSRARSRRARLSAEGNDPHRRARRDSHGPGRQAAGAARSRRATQRVLSAGARSPRAKPKC